MHSEWWKFKMTVKFFCTTELENVCDEIFGEGEKKHIWIMIKIIVNQNSSFWCCIFSFCDGNKMTMSNFKKVQKITNDWSHMVHRYSNKIKLPAEQIYLDISNSKMVDQKW